MKRYITLFLFCFLWTSVAAQDSLYPNRIRDLSPLDFSGFENIYLEIYKDSHKESSTETINRTREYLLWTQDPLGEDNSIIWNSTIRDIQNICHGQVPNTIQTESLSLNDSIQLSTEIRQLCEQEQKLLRLENNMARRNTYRTLFSNESLVDSPFDIIHDLHKIDRIFYGEKFEDQKPSTPKFPTYIYTSGFIPQAEFWQDQTQKNIEKELGDVFSNKEYASYKDSIVGNLAGMDPALDTLARTSLMTGVATNQVFESSLHKGTSGEAIGASPNITTITPPDKTSPESETILLFRVFHVFQGIIDRFLQENNIAELYLKSGNTNAQKDQSFIHSGEQRRRNQFFLELQKVEEDSEFLANSQHFGISGTSRNNAAFIQWNKDLTAFLGTSTKPYSGARGIHAIFKNLLMPKPQK